MIIEEHSLYPILFGLTVNKNAFILCAKEIYNYNVYNFAIITFFL